MGANARQDKRAVSLQLRKELEELKVLLRLGQDVKASVNFRSFARAIAPPLPSERNRS